jgi:hypothetical protein
MIRRNALPLTLLCVYALFFQGLAEGGMVTYKIVNYPAQQDGWTLSGTITINTTEASGTLTAKDITSWNWTIKKDKTVVNIGRTGAGSGVEIDGTVRYTPTQILLPPGTAEAKNQFVLTTAFGSNNMLWNNNPSGIYSGTYVNDANRRVRAWFDPTTTLGGNTTWVIAIVPEPSTILLAGIGFSCVLLCVMARQRCQIRDVFGLIVPGSTTPIFRRACMESGSSDRIALGQTSTCV